MTPHEERARYLRDARRQRRIVRLLRLARSGLRAVKTLIGKARADLPTGTEDLLLHLLQAKAITLEAELGAAVSRALDTGAQSVGVGVERAEGVQP